MSSYASRWSSRLQWVARTHVAVPTRLYALILCRRGFPVGALRFAQPSDDWPEPPRFLRRLWGTFHENAHQRLAACDALCRTRAYEPVARHFIEGFFLAWAQSLRNKLINV